MDWYEELDASGGDSSRPLWNKALTRIDRGEVRGLAVWNFSRFSRSTVDALRALERIEEAGGSLYSASGDVGDTTPTGKLADDLRWPGADGARAGQGQLCDGPAGGNRARGLHRIEGANWLHAESRHPEAGAERDGPRHPPDVRDAGEGASWVELVKHLMAHGGSDKTTAQTVSNMLRNPAYIGVARHGEFATRRPMSQSSPAASSTRSRASRCPGSAPGRAAAGGLLGGLVVCENCGYRMFTSAAGQGRGLSYSCKHIQCARRASVRAVDLDAEVLGRILHSWRARPRRCGSSSHREPILRRPWTLI